MLGRWLAAITRVSVRRPWWILGIAALAAVLALLSAGTRLTLRTSNLDLVDADLAPVRRFTDFATEFGTPNMLVVVLQGAAPEHLAAAVDRIGPVVRRLDGVRSVVDKRPIDPDLAAAFAPDPYLTSFDRSRFFLFVQPNDPTSRATTIAPFVEAVRAAVAQLDLGASGLEVGFTGLPEYALDDRDTVRADVSRLSLVALVLVATLFASAFGSVLRPLFAVVALLVAVAITLGLVAWYPGYLTLLSAFFASILLGLGIDFGIHVVDRMEELLAEGVAYSEAIEGSVAALAPSLATSALTTAALFAVMLFSGFRGFEELGSISALGISLCLLSMVSVLPALLAVVRPAGRERRLGERRLGRWLTAVGAPRAVAALGAIAVLISLVGRPGFDTDYLDLQPADSEAVRLEREMVDSSDYSTQFAAFTVDSREAAVELTRRLWAEPTVGAVRSILESGVETALRTAAVPSAAALERMLVSPEGRYAVYAYPAENIWSPEVQDAFVGAMQAIDPEVTGMPLLGRFMVERSRRALGITALLGSLVLLGCVYLDLRRLLPTLLAILPTALAVATTLAVMELLGWSFNPLNVMALPVVLGIAVDDGIHLVHRFIAERGDLERTLAGSGRSVLMTSLTTIAAFGALCFASHRGLASFARLITVGVGAALLYSLLLLPPLLAAVRRRLEIPRAAAAEAVEGRVG